MRLGRLSTRAVDVATITARGWGVTPCSCGPARRAAVLSTRELDVATLCGCLQPATEISG